MYQALSFISSFKNSLQIHFPHTISWWEGACGGVWDLKQVIKRKYDKINVKNMMGVGKQGEQWLPFQYAATKILY